MQGQRARQETRGIQPEGRGGQGERLLHGDIFTGKEACMAPKGCIKG